MFLIHQKTCFWLYFNILRAGGLALAAYDSDNCLHRVNPPIVGHYHILDIKNKKILTREKYAWKIFTKNSCKTISYWLHGQGITEYLQ